MLFYGGPGTGKTSTVLALCHDLFPDPILLKSRILELNASDERGISVVREKIKSFCRAVPSNPSHIDPTTIPPFKIIILDEADSMTSDAQSALRRMMETYSRGTRFCLVCNYVSRIIEPLASRCAKFRFLPLPKQDIFQKLTSISENERVLLEHDVLNTLVDVADGDLRQAITLLQSAFRLYGSEQHVTSAAIQDLAGLAPELLMQSLMDACQSGDALKVKAAVNDAVLEGFAVSQILSQVLDYILNSDSLSEKQKADISIKFAETDKRLVDGADEELQLLDALVYTSIALKS